MRRIFRCTSDTHVMRMKRNWQFFLPFLALIFNSPDPDGPNTIGGWYKVRKQIKVKLTQIGLSKGVPLRPKMRINVNWHFQSARIRNASAYAHHLHETHRAATAWPSLVLTHLQLAMQAWCWNTGMYNTYKVSRFVIWGMKIDMRTRMILSMAWLLLFD